MSENIFELSFELSWRSSNFCKAVEIWCCYYAITESYDKNVCTGVLHNDCAIPENEYQRTLSNKHARALDVVCRKIFTELEISIKDIEEAKRMSVGMSFAKQEQIAQRSQWYADLREASVQIICPPTPPQQPSKVFLPRYI